MQSHLTTLKTAGEFTFARAHGLKHVTQNFILQYSKQIDAPDYTFGFIITRKIGCAVIRNLIRRRLKALARELILNKTLPGAYVFIARNQSKTASYEDLKNDMVRALKGLKVLKNDSL